MYKTIFCVLLLLMFSGCTKPNKTTESVTPPTTPINTPVITEDANLQECVFKLAKFSFSVVLSSDWDVDEKANTYMYKTFNYMNKKKNMEISFVPYSKKEQEIYFASKKREVSKSEISDYTFNLFCKFIEGNSNYLKEDAPLAVRQVDNKTIKSFICDVPITEKIKHRKIYFLVEFKDSDVFLTGSQTCNFEDWDKEKESMKQMLDSVQTLDAQETKSN